MTIQAKENHSKIVKSIDPVTFNIWEKEILHAERDRVKNITAINVYQAQIPSLAGTGVEPGVGPALGACLTLQEQWMEFVLLVEESQ